MSAMRYRGVFKSGTVLLEDSVSLPDGTEVIVTPAERKQRSAATILAAVRSEPHLTLEEIEELEQAIASGRRRLSRIDVFSKDFDSPGTA